MTEKLVNIANAQTVGDGLNPATTFGPIQNKAQYEKVKGLIAAAVAKGGQIITAVKDLSEKRLFRCTNFGDSC